MKPLALPMIIMGIGGYGFSALFKVTTIFIMLLYIVKSITTTTIKPVVYALALLLYFIFSVLFSVFDGINLNGIVADSYYLLISICSILLNKHSRISSHSIVQVKHVVCASLAANILIYLVQGYTFGYFTAEYGGFRINTSMGPATAAIFYLSVFIFGFYFKSNPLKILSFILMILTQARTPVAVACTIFCIDIIINQKNFLKKIAFFLFVFVGLILFLVANSDRSADINIFAINNIADLNLNTSGRGSLWSYIVDNLDLSLFGNGLGSVNRLIVNDFQIVAGYAEDQPHNDYLRIAYNQGIIGILIMSILVVSVGFRFYSNLPDTLPLYYFLFALLALMATDNILIYPFFLYPFLIMQLLVAGREYKENE